ncbi:MAG TPA: NTP transferase domain-containing protein [Holophaga sp.]|nr:NTP transferase domain-containing protein [Holophaga sp.]
MTKEIEGFILAAGLGTRMGPLSRILPKPAWPMGGRSVLAHGADGLRRAGLGHLACNAHHLPGALRAAAAEADVEVFEEPVLLGSAGGLRHARGRCAEALAVWNGDILADPPWARFLEAHRALRADLSWLLVPHPGGPWNPVWLSPEGRILGPGETGEGPYHFCGPAIWGPRALALLPDEGPADTKAHVLPRLDRAFGVVVDPFPFFEIGSPDQLIEAAARVAPGGEGRVPGSYVHLTAEPPAELTRCVLGPGARPPAAIRDHDAFWFQEDGNLVRLAL